MVTQTGQNVLSDKKYTHNRKGLKSLQSRKPWTTDPKWFDNATFSPSATIKMMEHTNSGVSKGYKQGSKPIEVMGLLLGRVDVANEKSIIITDAFKYLESNINKYDIIIADFPDPRDVFTSKLYSKEFYIMAQKSLNI